MHRLLLLIAVPVGEMHVTIDQAREDCGLTQVDHFGAGRNLDAIGWTDVRNPVVPDEHHQVGEISARLGVEQATGADRDHLRGLMRLGAADRRREHRESDKE